MKWMADQEFAELGDAGMGMSLPVRLAIAHCHFEAVHPFSDGNGRVGRVLFTLQMAASGFLPLYISGFIEAHQSDYVTALQKAQKKLEYSSIIEFICEAIIASRLENDVTKQALLKLPSRWELKGSFRANSAAKRAHLFLLSNPIFTANQLQKALDVSMPAATRAAIQLCNAKIVRERTGFGRNRVFAAEEVIELLSRKFGDSENDALERAKELLSGNSDSI